MNNAPFLTTNPITTSTQNLTSDQTETLQGHTKQVTGYGSVSIPNNAKGGVEAILKGVTDGEKHAGQHRLVSVEKNLFDGQLEKDGFNVDGSPMSGGVNDYTRSKNFTHIDGGTQYYLSNDSSLSILYVYYYDANYTFISSASDPTLPITTPSNAKYLKFCYASAYIVTANVQIEKNIIATPYEPRSERITYILADVGETGEEINLLTRQKKNAEEEYSDVTVYGDVEVSPNGAVYTEPCLAGRTNTAVTVITTAERPIKSIRKVYRYDYNAGDVVMVDVTATVTGSNTSITIANFDPNKWYLYDCEYDSQYTTNPQIVLNCVVDGGIVSHDFEAASADWTLTNNESKASTFILTNAGGAANMVMVPQDGINKTIINSSGQTITVKATSTGLALTNGKTTTVLYNGTDYIKVSEV